MRLVENWKKAWTWISVWTLAVLGSLPMVWGSLPPDIKALVPDGWGVWIFLFIALGGIVGRVVSQTKAPE